MSPHAPAVLVIDRDLDFLAVASTVLQRACPAARIVTADNAAAALFAVRQPGLDLCLLDAGLLPEDRDVVKHTLRELHEAARLVMVLDEDQEAPHESDLSISRPQLDTTLARELLYGDAPPEEGSPEPPPLDTPPRTLAERVLDALEGDIAMLVGQDGSCSPLNHAARDFLGPRRRAPLDLSDLLPTAPHAQAALDEAIDAARRGEIRSIDAPALTAAGEVVTLRFRLHPLYDDLDVIEAVVMIAVDVSAEERRAEEERRRADELVETARRDREALRRQSEAVTEMSRELRAPLSTIAGYADLLRAGVYGPMNDRQQAVCETMQERGQALAGLLDDLIDLARIEAGTTRVVREAVDLLGLLEDVRGWTEKRAALLKVAVQVALDIEPGLPWVTSDRRMLRRILLALLDNAVRHAGGGMIIIRARMVEHPGGDEGELILRVSDEGPGLPSGLRSRLFERFSSGDPERGGQGLGLYLARALTTYLGGRLEADGHGNEGCTFTIRLPGDAPADEPSAATQVGAPFSWTLSNLPDADQ